MKIWIVRDQEPTPLDGDNVRLLRAGLIAESFSGHGHDVTWFTSTFDHYSRKQRPAGRFTPREHLTIEVLPAAGYRKNISLGRILHNRKFAGEFTRSARLSALTNRPDIILADLPTTEAAAAAVHFGRSEKIPTIVTIRDLWPDFFSDFVPGSLKPLVRLGLMPLERQARYACANATSLVGISETYLKWGQSKGQHYSSEDRIFHLGYPSPPPPAADVDAVLERLAIPSRGKVATFIGSWGATYDLPLLLAAARLIPKETELTIAVAGDGSASPALVQEFAQLPNVRLLGWIEPPEISALLTRSSLGLLPYRQNAPQGLPNKVFEYMAYGLFQIATLEGEARSLFADTDTGISLPRATPQDLANAICAAVSDEAIEKNRPDRRAVFERQFKAEKIYDNLLRHVEDIARRHAQGSGQ